MSPRLADGDPHAPRSDRDLAQRLRQIGLDRIPLVERLRRAREELDSCRRRLRDLDRAEEEFFLSGPDAGPEFVARIHEYANQRASITHRQKAVWMESNAARIDLSGLNAVRAKLRAELASPAAMPLFEATAADPEPSADAVESPSRPAATARGLTIEAIDALLLDAITGDIQGGAAGDRLHVLSRSRDGVTDGQIRDLLRLAWRDTVQRRDPDPRRNFLAQGGPRPRFWAGSAAIQPYVSSPTLQGPRLIARARHVLKLEAPADRLRRRSALAAMKKQSRGDDVAEAKRIEARAPDVSLA